MSANLPIFLKVFLQVAEIALLLYLGGTALYLLVFSVAALVPYRPKKRPAGALKRFAIIFPCYKEDEIIFDVVQDALEHNYPKSHFDVIVVADGFRPETIKKLETYPIILFSKDFEVSTKTRAINFALRQLNDSDYDAVCILDADNLMADDFIHLMNDALSAGHLAVQGHRIAKNLNTHFAVLDAASEEINNRIFRKGQRVLGLSSALIGSAMAFDFKFFKALMADVEVVGGFDKELELRMLSNGIVIDYVDNAYVYDEKVQNARVFTRQRRRWLSAQYHYFGKHFTSAVKALVSKGNIEYFNKAIQYLQLPRLLLLGLLFIFALAATLWPEYLCAVCWQLAFLTILIAIALALPPEFYNMRTFTAIIRLPLVFGYMLLSLLQIKGANKQFIHTKHTYNAFQKKRHKKH
ncbi:MAG TPA: glycosyltransferase [Bacteroidales bacterium]|nr:glycosyltransferase [Bacteroidales bacterium]